MGGCANSVRIKHKISISIFLTGEALPGARDRSTAVQQMQRTINALVGEHGTGYKEDPPVVGNPLDGMGEAIIPSLRTLESDKQEGATEARKIAELARELALKAVGDPGIQRWGKVVYYLLRAALEAIDP